MKTKIATRKIDDKDTQWIIFEGESKDDLELLQKILPKEAKSTILNIPLMSVMKKLEGLAIG